ncbi:NAD(P)/FAD-dependent oxidoreductase [Streptacidiphilus sp. ASG 303]|uniref:phytoene desaturase family protein n=1 Tax=Streptacidiphilus sp. ASG 303 TaxID=2896847 RepID=UPI001E2853C3|nr:NAD(P)/FAD-dependent oxidoreductase [Streptacidiphilus sp. ASG 303]MCD0481649.1 NAD(P)/FAD-dependent oxidoreductase [Streptacidiphilus sp. ASG 303]
MARIVVIGAGMGGLAAAARLATVGHRVLVCEASGTYGGMVGRYARDGFAFDTGPALLALPAVYRDLALKTGRERLEDLVDLAPVDPESRHLLPDGTEVLLPNVSRAGVVRALDDAFGAGAGERWGAVMDRGRQVWEATRRPLLEEPLADDPRPLHADPYPAVRRGLARLRRGPWTLADVARHELGGQPGPAALLGEYALRHGLDPRRAPASTTVVPYMEQTFGVWRVGGGLRALADAVHARCEQRRVEFLYHAPVSEVVVEDGRAAGVELSDGSRIDADLVVSAIDVRALYGQHLVPWERQDAWPPVPAPAPGRLTVLLALRGARPEGTAHRTVVHAADPADELDALFSASPRPCDRPTVQVLRPGDPAQVPDGAHEAAVLTVTVPRHGPVDWTAPGLADAYADRVLAHVDAAGLGLAGRVLWRVVRTPADTERETGAPGGSVPAPSLAGAGGAFLAPANRSPLPGLLLAGGSAHPGGGLPRAGMSAAVTAALAGTP